MTRIAPCLTIHAEQDSTWHLTADANHDARVPSRVNSLCAAPTAGCGVLQEKVLPLLALIGEETPPQVSQEPVPVQIHDVSLQLHVCLTALWVNEYSEERPFSSVQ